MKKNKIIYWTTTGIVSLMMLFSAYLYVTSPEVEAGFRTMGFPDYFRLELSVAKVLGALVLLVPMAPYALKFAAYVGFVIVFISAAIAHLSIGDGPGAVMPLLFLGLLVVSYIFYRKTGLGVAIA